MMALSVPCPGMPYSVEITPTADALVWSMAPDANYGKAGGLSVSGSAALNRQGKQMGTLDTFMRFDLAGLVADLMAGGDVSLFLTAGGDSIGFTFSSRDIAGGGRVPPNIEITAQVIPEPGTLALVALGLCVLSRKSRTRR